MNNTLVINEGSQVYRISAIKLTSCPLLMDGDIQNTGANILRSLSALPFLYDNCYSSAVELKIISHNSQIYYTIVITTTSPSTSSELRHQVFINTIKNQLLSSYFTFEDISISEIEKLSPKGKDVVSLSLKKKYKTSYGINNNSSYVPIMNEYSLAKVLKALNSDVTITFIYIPKAIDLASKENILQSLRLAANQRNGLMPQLADGDNLVVNAEKSWKYYADNLESPSGYLNIVVTGNPVDALEASSTTKAATNIDWYISELTGYRSFPIHKRPWLTNLAIAKKNPIAIEIYPVDEVATLFELPHYLPNRNCCAKGLPMNPSSLVPEPSYFVDVPDPNVLIGKSTHRQYDIRLPWSSLLKHVLINGLPGTGKTTFIKRLIREANKRGYNVLIIEPAKREFISLLKEIDDLKVFNTDDLPLLMNIMLPPENVTVGAYCGALLESFKASISMPDPLPSLISDALISCFEHHGFTRHSLVTDENVQLFNLNEFIVEIKRLLNSSQYSSEVKGNVTGGSVLRLKSLISRLPTVINTLFSVPVEEIISGTTILELGNSEIDQKRLLVSLLLKRISLHFNAKHESTRETKLLIVCDEAHSLFSGPEITEEDKGLKSSINQLLGTFVRESRSQGIGVIIADQSPDCVSQEILNLFNTIISFRVQGDHAEKIAHLLDNMNSANIQMALSSLNNGEFIIRSDVQNEPLIVKAIHQNVIVEDNNISNDEVAKLLKHQYDIRPFPACLNACEKCSIKCRDTAIMKANNLYDSVKKNVASTVPEMQGKVLLNEILSIRNKLDKNNLSEDDMKHLHYCIALHLLNRMSQDVTLSSPETILEIVLSAYHNTHK